ncbi:histidine kinase [Nostoc piscinale CENA21]|uniref:Circadian input-output histidine kinase CikA n=1 Tax=Nostoc piscinale CENA21 TaxID=224013 RepID=A0A0M4T6Y9_9NOSO|nr:ATP-binding protein [Nostoc piscinale]ALF55041.1 histidine kinase [Nostoc piscinale CENA21]
MEETLRILVVDDDEVDRMAVRRALMQAGVKMELSEADNGHEALLALASITFDCVFLDYRLPDQDGLTLIRRVQASEIKVPLVVLTAQGDEQIAVELMKAGATDYLAKSRVSSETLAQILRNAMRVYRAEMQANLALQQLKESHEQLIRKNQELERQRQQIQLQNLKLIEASRLKTQFLATMSHELRTPMNAIIGFSQILLRPKFGQLSPQQTDMVERILNNGKHLLMLLNEVLDFSKLEAGRLELKAELFDLTTVINSTVKEMQSLAEAKKLALQVQIDLENPWVFNDSVRLRQILVNLLSNAIKFTETGSIWLEVEELPENRIAIAVRDTGIGIAPKDFQHIFEAFRQVDQSLTRKYPGTGLGLAIVDSLVRMMNGKILIESQLGVGSMFKIELPRQILAKDIAGKIPALNVDGEHIFFSAHNPHKSSPPSRRSSMRYPNLKL